MNASRPAEPAPAPPVIGITTYARNAEDHFALPAPYIDAVRRAGGIPLLLAHGEPQADALLDTLDGVILSGGGDLDPLHYNGTPHASIYEIDAERDATELTLVRRFVQRRIPALCICRGHQVLNVALGGTLFEHLPDHVGSTIAHRLDPDEAVPHIVTIQPDTRLAAMMGAGEASGISWHHQAIRIPAPNLAVTAYAPDGTIEAVEHADHPWLIGVQWHPELSAATDSRQQALFNGLMDAARAYRMEVYAT